MDPWKGDHLGWAGRIDVGIEVKAGIVGIVAGVEETEDRADDFGIVGEAVKDGWKCSSEVDLDAEDNQCNPPAVVDVAMHGSYSIQVGVGGERRLVGYPSGSLGGGE